MADSDQVKETASVEKENKQPMTFRQKIEYFKDYYLLKVVLVLLALVFVGLFIRDAYKNSKTIYTGGTVGFDLYDDKFAFLSDGFINYLGDDYKGKKAQFGGNALMIPEGQEYERNNVETAFVAQVNAGMYNYLFMAKKEFDYFVDVDIYQDISYIKEDPRFSGLDYVTGFEGKTVGIRLSEEALSKLGVSDMDIYLVFAIKKNQNDLNLKFVEYLYS